MHHTIDLSPRLRIVADEDPNPVNPREDQETPVGVYVPLDHWFNTIPEVHHFPGPIEQAHQRLGQDDVRKMDRVARWAWIFYDTAVVHDGVRYWFADKEATRALVTNDPLSREEQVKIVNQERGNWFRYAKEPAWQVWLERKASFRRTSKHWNENTQTLLTVWEQVSDRCGSLYLDASFLDVAAAQVVQENFGALLSNRERAAVEALVDSGRALQ